MNKQELFEKISDLDEITIRVPTNTGLAEVNYLRKPEVLELIEQLDEPKKLYTVKIAEATLTKITRGSNVRYKMLPFGDISDVFDKVIYTTRLTEQEIKQKDERLWQFAKEVE